MKEKRRVTRFILVTLALGLLSGCETASRVADIFTEPTILPCPDYRILMDGAQFVSYAGERRDLTDIDSEAEIANMSIVCTTKIDEETRTGLQEVEITFIFNASRGPANRSRRARYPYFISVTDSNRKILYREEFDIEADFTGNRSKVSFRNEPITIELDITPERGPKDYIIFGGFALNREQLELNRKRRQFRRN